MPAAATLPSRRPLRNIVNTIVWRCLPAFCFQMTAPKKEIRQILGAFGRNTQCFSKQIAAAKCICVLFCHTLLLIRFLRNDYTHVVVVFKLQKSHTIRSTVLRWWLVFYFKALKSPKPDLNNHTSNPEIVFGSAEACFA